MVDADKPQQDAPMTLVVGAGFLGSQIVHALAGKVRATTRSGQWTAASERPEHAELRQLDICTDTQTAIREVLTGVTHLVICVAPGRTQPRRAVYLEGVRRLLSIALESGSTRRGPTSEPRSPATPTARESTQAHPGLKKIVYTSSTSALPVRDGIVRDDEPDWPTSERGRVQREAEQQVDELCRHAGVPHLILRLGGLYGPGRGIGRIYRVRTPGPLAGDGGEATNLIHRDDAVACIRAALTAPSQYTGTINVCADDHRSRRELYELAARVRGESAPIWERPPAPEPYGKRVDNSRMKAWLGVNLRFALHDVRE